MLNQELILLERRIKDPSICNHLVPELLDPRDPTVRKTWEKPLHGTQAVNAYSENHGGHLIPIVVSVLSTEGGRTIQNSCFTIWLPEPHTKTWASPIPSFWENKYRQYLRRKKEGGQHAVVNSGLSRFPTKRRSVFDSGPDQPSLNYKHQMSILPKGHSLYSMHRSVVRPFSSPLPATAYNMGIAVAPRPTAAPLATQKQQQQLDNICRSNFWVALNHGNNFTAAGTLPSFGMRYSQGFNTMQVPVAGNPSAIDAPGLRGNNDIGFRMGGDVAVAMAAPHNISTAGPANNYVGLQLLSATGQIGFGQSGSAGSNAIIADDGAITDKDVDYELLNQSVHGELDTEKGNGIQIDFNSVGHPHNESTITTVNGSTSLPEVSPSENLQVQNKLSVNLSEMVFDSFSDSVEDFSLETLNDLLFGQEEKNGNFKEPADIHFNISQVNDNQRGEMPKHRSLF